MLAKLQELSIEHETHRHGAVMTCEAQVNHHNLCHCDDVRKLTAGPTCLTCPPFPLQFVPL